MAEFNRRKFLIAGGVGAVGLLSGAVALTLPDMLHAAHDRPLPEGSGILVIVTLYGGNDGINTVIPYTDNAYHDSRPDLAYKPEEVLPLDGQLGLNPALAGLSEIWKSRSLAIVRGVGYPNPDRSHFRSMDIWQTASPKEPVPTGWIGRWLDATGDDPLRAVNVGGVMPLMSIGERQVASALSGWFPGVPDETMATLTALSQDDPRDTAEMSAIRRTYRASKITEPEFGRVLKRLDPAAAAKDADVDSLEAQLDLVARCVEAAVPTRVYMVQFGGFDTHAAERDTHQQLLQAVDTALHRFLREMRIQPHGKTSCLMAIRSSAAGYGPTPHRAPTTAPPGRRSSQEGPSKAGSTAMSRH